MPRPWTGQTARRGLVTVVGAVALAGALVACSSEESTPAREPERPTGTATSTTPAGDLGPEEEALVRLMVRGVGERGSARVDLRTSGLLASRTRGVVSYDGAETSLRMTTVVPATGQAPTRLVAVDGTTYLAAPDLVPGGRYVALRSDDPRLRQWGGGGEGVSPADSVRAFRAGLLDARQVATERVGGQEATRYRLRVDARAALEAQGRTAPPAMPRVTTYDVWLDGRGRMLRLTTRVAGSRVVAEFSRWGAPVRIATPPPRLVVDGPGGP